MMLNRPRGALGRRKSTIFRRLIVLLDETTPLQGAFMHALEWAWHLRLPIHAWALPELDAGENLPKPIEPWDPLSAARLSAASVSDGFVTKVKACVEVCRRVGRQARTDADRRNSEPVV